MSGSRKTLRNAKNKPRKVAHKLSSEGGLGASDTSNSVTAAQVKPQNSAPVQTPTLNSVATSTSTTTTASETTPVLDEVEESSSTTGLTDSASSLRGGGMSDPTKGGGQFMPIASDVDTGEILVPIVQGERPVRPPQFKDVPNDEIQLSRRGANWAWSVKETKKEAVRENVESKRREDAELRARSQDRELRIEQGETVFETITPENMPPPLNFTVIEVGKDDRGFKVYGVTALTQEANATAQLHLSGADSPTNLRQMFLLQVARGEARKAADTWEQLTGHPPNAQEGESVMDSLYRLGDYLSDNPVKVMGSNGMEGTSLDGRKTTFY